jgi:GNAT superfamily N-acetyltransferase
MKVRDAVVDDAPAMGRVMVESFLAAHRGHMPEAAFQKRVEEWTPEVSARGWARALSQLADGNPEGDAILVAEGDDSDLLGLVSGGAAEHEVKGPVAEITALYVLPSRHGRGIGRSLLRAAADNLARLGFAELRVGVLSANISARAFYEAMGGRESGQGTFNEEGYLLPMTIYTWPDITSLGPRKGRRPRTTAGGLRGSAATEKLKLSGEPGGERVTPRPRDDQRDDSTRLHRR